MCWYPSNVAVTAGIAMVFIAGMAFGAFVYCFNVWVSRRVSTKALILDATHRNSQSI